MIQKKVKIFQDYHIKDLEDYMNKWFSDHQEIRVLHIQLSQSSYVDSYNTTPKNQLGTPTTVITALIHYEEV